MTPIRVLQVAPLWLPTGPDAPGGIETFLAALTRALARAGCEVTLLAVGGSDAGVPTVELIERGLFDAMVGGDAWDAVPYEQHALLEAMRRRGEHDLCHSHLGPAGFALSGAGPVLHTLHGQITPDVEWLVGRERDLWLSTPAAPQAERLRVAGARRAAVVPNGLDPSRFPRGEGGGPLVFLGRIERQKGPDLAIDVAEALGAELVLAGPLTDQGFFVSVIEPRLSGTVHYAGVLGHEQKCALLGSASCLLMPSRWEEPFGMVAIEAMACGTPVVALANGALADVVEHGVTGCVSADEAGLAAAVAPAAALDRGAVRERAIARFGIDEVAAEFLAVYEQLLA